MDSHWCTQLGVEQSRALFSCVKRGCASWHSSVFDVLMCIRSTQAAECHDPYFPSLPVHPPLPVQYKLVLNTGSTNTGVTGHVQ